MAIAAADPPAGRGDHLGARIDHIAGGPDTEGAGPADGIDGDEAKHDLVQRAREIGIKGRSKTTKAELIKALRDH